MNNPSPSIQAETEKVLTKKNNCQRHKTVSICGEKTYVMGESMKDRKLRGIFEIYKIINV